MSRGRGRETEDVRRKHGVSQQTFDRWNSKCGGMITSDAHKPKTLEDENRRLKKLLAESMPDVIALKDLLSRNYACRQGTVLLQAMFALSLRSGE